MPRHVLGQGLAERDRFVFERCRRHGLPLSVSMAGGYANQVETIAGIHHATIVLASRHARAVAAAVGA